MAAKRRSSKPQAQSAAPTALDGRQRALREEQEKVERHMEKLRRVIETAPQRAAEEQNRRRAEMASRSTRVDAPTRKDMRYDTTLTGALPQFSRRKPLRSQQRQARLIFFGLLVALTILVLWLWSVWKW